MLDFVAAAVAAAVGVEVAVVATFVLLRLLLLLSLMRLLIAIGQCYRIVGAAFVMVWLVSVVAAFVTKIARFCFCGCCDCY